MCVYASCHQLKKSINTCKEKNNNQKTTGGRRTTTKQPKKWLRIPISSAVHPSLGGRDEEWWWSNTQTDGETDPHGEEVPEWEREREKAPHYHTQNVWYSLSTRYSPDEEFVEYALTGVCVSTLRQELLRLNSSAIGARCPSGVGSITYKTRQKTIRKIHLLNWLFNFVLTLLDVVSPLPLQTNFSISVLKPSTEFLALELCVVGGGGTGMARDFLLSLDEPNSGWAGCCSVLVETATRLGEMEPEEYCWISGGLRPWWPRKKRCFCFLSRLGEDSTPRHENLQNENSC